MANQKRIVIIEDDEIFARILQLSLKKNGYQCYLISNIKDAMNFLSHANQVDLFIVDFELGDKTENGLDLCRKIRLHTGKPIIMLTGQSSTETTTSCLYAGANQFVIKPYVLDELLARIYVTLKTYEARTPLTNSGIKELYSGLKLNSSLRTLSEEDRTVSLTERELAVAEVLLGNENEDIRREYIFSAVYGRPMRPFSRAIDILVGRLRKKLNEVTNKLMILPTRNGGYRVVKTEPTKTANGSEKNTA